MKVNFSLCGWHSELDNLIDAFNPEVPQAVIHDLIDKKLLQAFEVMIDGVKVGYFISRIDCSYEGKKDFVVLWALSSVKGKAPMINVLGSLVSGLAKEIGCDRVRIHSDSRKMDAFLERGGFKYMETVYRKELNNA